MLDQLLAGQVITAINYPLQSLCFFMGGILTFIGLGMVVILSNHEWKKRGMSLLASGLLIGFPAVQSIMIAIIGDSSNLVLPNWFIIIVYYITPICGVLFGVYGWFNAEKELAESERNSK